MQWWKGGKVIKKSQCSHTDMLCRHFEGDVSPQFWSTEFCCLCSLTDPCLMFTCILVHTGGIFKIQFQITVIIIINYYYQFQVKWKILLRTVEMCFWHREQDLKADSLPSDSSLYTIYNSFPNCTGVKKKSKLYCAEKVTLTGLIYWDWFLWQHKQILLVKVYIENGVNWSWSQVH